MSDPCEGCILGGHAVRCRSAVLPLLLLFLLLVTFALGQVLLWLHVARQHGQFVTRQQAYQRALLDAMTLDKELADCLPLEAGPLPR